MDRIIFYWCILLVSVLVIMSYLWFRTNESLGNIIDAGMDLTKEIGYLEGWLACSEYYNHPQYNLGPVKLPSKWFWS